MTSLYVVSRLLQVVDGKNMVNFVASAILYTYTLSSMREATSNVTSQITSLSNHLHEMEEGVYPEDDSAENCKMNQILGHLSEYISTKPPFVSFPCDDAHEERLVNILV